jgi:DNA-binding NtrC family response regulator
MQKKQILLVDDEVSILNSFRKDFESEGYIVSTALNGEEALANIKEGHFNLLITDLSMPGIDGITVLMEAKKQDPEICTIVLTGYGDLSSAIEALRLGADDYLLKPCDTDELFLRVSRCLEKQELSRKVKLYERFLSICSYCKKIRDDTGTEPGKGSWVPIELYLQHKGDIGLSHGICPECYEKAIAEVDAANK